MSVTKETAQKFISPCGTDTRFWCNDGKVFSSLEELEKGFEEMKSETYHFHANKEKNDFANWVKDIIGDETLANVLKACTNKKAASKKIAERVRYLKGLAA